MVCTRVYSSGFSRRRPDERFIDHAQRYVTGDRSEVNQRLLRIGGELNDDCPVAEPGGPSSLILLRGVGPIWIPMGVFEFRELYLELSEARVGEGVIKPRETAVLSDPWGKVKGMIGDR